MLLTENAKILVLATKEIIKDAKLMCGVTQLDYPSSSVLRAVNRSVRDHGFHTCQSL